jgi:hypothetical protein
METDPARWNRQCFVDHRSTNIASYLPVTTTISPATIGSSRSRTRNPELEYCFRHAACGIALLAARVDRFTLPRNKVTGLIAHQWSSILKCKLSGYIAFQVGH